MAREPTLTLKYLYMKTNKTHRILIADDHILLRDALANLIASFSDFEVVAKAADGVEVIKLLEQGVQADILLMDLSMPNMDGYQTARQVAKLYPKLKTVILTMYNTDMVLIRLLHAGVCGFLKKDIHPRQLQEALSSVAAGEYYYSSANAVKIVSLLNPHASRDLSYEKLLLTSSEETFIKLCTTEMTYVEIAQAMQLKPKFIDNLRQTLFTKLHVNSRVSLAIYAVKNGLINLNEA